jgi:hypothetical protein
MMFREAKAPPANGKNGGAFIFNYRGPQLRITEVKAASCSSFLRDTISRTFSRCAEPNWMARGRGP